MGEAVNIRERIKAMLKPNADGLLPCPWCGGTDVVADDLESYVYCWVCHRWMESEESRRDLRAAWNRRPYLRALLLAIEQRDDWIACDPSLDEAELAAKIAKYDVPILAILDGKESP